MIKIILVLFVCALSACSAGVRPDAQWDAYREQVSRDEQAGVFSASEAQARLREGWVRIYGQDPAMMGYFAYSETLLRSAEHGLIPMADAKELVKEHERAARAEYQNSRRRQVVEGPEYDL